jgi:hypothetical protein
MHMAARHLAGREVVLHTDSEEVLFGWEYRRVNNGVSASILLCALHLIASFLGCSVFISHLPRMSNDSAKLANHLTRVSSTKADDFFLIRKAHPSFIPDDE